jgi:hypothetical protein
MSDRGQGACRVSSPNTGKQRLSSHTLSYDFPTPKASGKNTESIFAIAVICSPRIPLIQALLHIPHEGHTTMAQSCLPPGHFRSRLATRRQCVWCKAHPEERRLKWKPRRLGLGEVVDGVRPTGPIRPPDTMNGCGLCDKHLCLRGPCFDRFHSQIRS